MPGEHPYEGLSIADSSGERKVSVTEALENAKLDGEDNLVIRYMDAVIVEACDEISVYSLLWAAKACRVDYFIVYCLSVLLQLIVPAYLISRRSHLIWEALAGERGPSEFGIKETTFLLSVYLVSTFTGSLKRATVLSYMADMLPERYVALRVGSCVITACIFLTSGATMVLFLQDATVQDILLNCVALNFLPDIDISIATLLELLETNAVQHTKQRLAVFQEAYPESKERQDLDEYMQLSFTDQSRKKPGLILSRIAWFVTVFVMVTVPVLNTLLI